VLESDQIAAAHAAYPSAGTLRVHPAPEVLLPPEPERPGLNRFDDPDGRTGVRYTATRLIGCLRETMARFRPSPTAEATLAAITGIDEDDYEPHREDTEGIADWLAVQRVGTVRATSLGPFIDVERDELLVALDKHPNVRAALAALDPAARLDIAWVRLGGTIGRPVSQAVGVAIREWIADALGIGYRSRLATDEPCWAIWDTTSVVVTSVVLDPSDPLHRNAVRTVATAYEITLPSSWE
jgi:hypothetical protein